MKFSIKLKGNTQRIDKAGFCALYHQVIINSKKKDVPIDLRWEAKYIDNEAGQILPRSKDDEDFHDYLLIIQTKKEEINEILKWNRLADKNLSIGDFTKQLENFSSRFDFIQYWSTKNEEKYKEKQISKQTWKNHKSAIAKLKEFRAKLPFSDINTEFGTKYRTWLKNQYIAPTKNQTTADEKPYKLNTISGFLTKMKVYIAEAKKEGFAIQNPFDKPIKTNEGEIVYLGKDEIINLHQYLKGTEITPAEEIVLRGFLFQCFTGLRHSDLIRTNWTWVKNNELIFEPYKTRHLSKRVTIPLCNTAKSLIKTKKGEFFETISNQKMNSRLKEIAAKADIFKNLTTHAGRHTFATQFLENGGRVEYLQKLLGHTKILTTMIYVHIIDAQKRIQINYLDNILKMPA
jgi:integrase/recombinase XerD